MSFFAVEEILRLCNRRDYRWIGENIVADGTTAGQMIARDEATTT
jgi:hypothetical protein